MAYTTIDDPSVYFQTVLYTGNGGTGRGITLDGNSDLQPDWIWIKCRNAAEAPIMFDSVRGATKRIIPSATSEESTEAQEVTAFNTDGFTIGNSDNANKNTKTFVAWNWKAGTSFTNDASSTGIGTIDSTGTVNETAGFSIVSYTSTGSNGSIKHGLSTVPHWILFKRRSGDTENWPFYHQDLGATHIMKLNSTDAKSDTATRFNDVEPTSSVFTVGTSGDTNGGTSPFLAYCFAEKKGYSKFESYTGNGNADGTFVYTGFKPSFVIRKKSSGAESWQMHDNKRDTFNVVYHRLLAEDSGSEYTSASNQLDFTAQGFKMRATNDGGNASGGTYIYMAFAESPFVNSNKVPNNAT